MNDALSFVSTIITTEPCMIPNQLIAVAIANKNGSVNSVLRRLKRRSTTQFLIPVQIRTSYLKSWLEVLRSELKIYL
ncbi:hypothetical protein D3C87_183010 [compost metagenome]